MARSATAKSNPTVSALNHKFSITVLTCVKHKKYVIDHADHSNAVLSVEKKLTRHAVSGC